MLEESALLVVRRLVEPNELSITASDVLHRLDSEGPVRLTALAVAAGVSQPSMTQLIQRFERRGLVCRGGDPDDRRASLVAITDAGRELVEERRHSLRIRLAELLSSLSSDELAALELATRVALPIITRLSGRESVPDAQPSVA